MLTKQQIKEAEAAAREIAEGGLRSAELEVLPTRTDAEGLELNAAQELNEAVQCLERRDRAGARAHITMALDKINEAEIDD